MQINCIFWFVVNSVVRLVGGSSAREGVVEINYNGSWGVVCSDTWSKSAAMVVCRQLGYGEAIWAKLADYYLIKALLSWKTNINCSGTEENIFECQGGDIELGNCQWKAAVKCYSGRTVVKTMKSNVA